MKRDRSKLTWVIVPYTNERVWVKHPHAHRGFAVTDEFGAWINEQGLNTKGLWFDNTEASTDEYRVLLFKDKGMAVYFKLIWCGQ